MVSWLLIAALVQTLAESPETGLELTWDAPRGCDQADSVRARVGARLAGRPQPDVSLNAAGTITASDAGYVMSLTLRQGENESARSFEATTCEEVVETAVLLMVMTLDPLAIPEPPPTEPEPQPEPEPAPEPEPPPEPEPEPEPAPAPAPEPEPQPQPPGAKLEARGRLGGGLGFGPLPGVSGVFELAAGVGQTHWAAHVTAEAWTPSSAQTERGSTAEVWLAGFGLEGCGILAPARRWTVPLCAAVAAGPMTARGLDVREADTARTAWVVARAAPGVVGWIWPWVGIGAHVSGHVTLRRPRFAIEPSGTVHAARSAGLRAWAFVSFRNRRTW